MNWFNLPEYEQDEPDTYPDAVQIEGHPGVAWHVLGWETESSGDFEWTGETHRTGQLVCVMVGDDHKWLHDPQDVKELAREDYCGECGQIGCGHDGYDREDT